MCSTRLCARSRAQAVSCSFSSSPSTRLKLLEAPEVLFAGGGRPSQLRRQRSEGRTELRTPQPRHFLQHR
jgi:hypothetical protein